MLHSIHRAGPASFGPAFYLLQRFFAEEGFATPPDAIRANLQGFLSEPRYAVFLAEQGGQVVGIATVSTALSVELGRMAEMDDLYVLPEARGAGVAKTLVAAAVEWCREQGCIYIQVTLTPEGAAAHHLTRFYTRLGFAATGRTLMAQELINREP